MFVKYVFHVDRTSFDKTHCKLFHQKLSSSFPPDGGSHRLKYAFGVDETSPSKTTSIWCSRDGMRFSNAHLVSTRCSVESVVFSDFFCRGDANYMISVSIRVWGFSISGIFPGRSWESSAKLPHLPNSNYLYATCTSPGEKS